MKLNILATTIAAICLSAQATAYTVYEDDVNKFDIGGAFVVDIFKPTSDMDAIFYTSRSTFNLAFERELGNDWSTDVKLEWDNFLNAPSSYGVNGDNFRNRLGYISLNNESLGSVRIGKQWSAYHDVAKYMDNLIIIDPDATPIYSDGRDGGFLATGRGDNLVAYRNTLGGLNLSAHYGFGSTSETVDIDRDYNVAAAASYDFESGVSIGATYLQNKVYVDSSAPVMNLKDGDTQDAISAGAQYAQGPIKVAAMYTKGTKVHKAGLLGHSDLEYADANGIDVYAHYMFDIGLRPYAYYSNLDFDDSAVGVTGDRQVYALGLTYHYSPKMMVTAEFKRNVVDDLALGSVSDNGGGFNAIYAF
ncbi:porin [Vibrio cionasavignyae]|uniref:porin n=1 Tax=Vibrio cionasavignyae TaxID=2910252 RepID=UPI003D1107B8